MKSDMKLITIVDRFSLSLMQTLIPNEKMWAYLMLKLEEAFID